MNILFVADNGVPRLGRASDSRMVFIANLLSESYQVSILNRYTSSRSKRIENVPLNVSINCKEIINPRDTGRFLSILFWMISVLFEPFVIIRYHMHEKIDCFHVYSGHYIDYLLYYILSRVIGAKVVCEYVEYRSAKKKNRSIYHKINGWLSDNFGARLWDGCIAISNFLEAVVKEVNPNIPVIKITPLCDFSIFEANMLPVAIDSPYILFCGHAGYFEVVKLVIDSYHQSRVSHTKKLVLVLGGHDKQILKIKDYAPDCSILKHLPYDELIAYYKHAFALMIPLRNTLEDLARFPNKICEYVAAGGLIVTTKYGEIPYYFKDGFNAVIADDCSELALAEKLDKIELGQYNVEDIKNNCKKLGMSFFCFDVYRELLANFFSIIIK